MQGDGTIEMLFDEVERHPERLESARVRFGKGRETLDNPELKTSDDCFRHQLIDRIARAGDGCAKFLQRRSGEAFGDVALRQPMIANHLGADRAFQVCVRNSQHQISQVGGRPEAVHPSAGRYETSRSPALRTNVFGPPLEGDPHTIRSASDRGDERVLFNLQNGACILRSDDVAQVTAYRAKAPGRDLGETPLECSLGLLERQIFNQLPQADRRGTVRCLRRRRGSVHQFSGVQPSSLPMGEGLTMPTAGCDWL